MHLENFIVSALLILAATAVAITLSKRLGLGSVLGLLVAGMVLSPHSPGSGVVEHVDDVRNFAELGVVLLLFLIGLEMKPRKLWKLRREIFGLGLLQIILCGLLITAYAYYYFQNLQTAIIIGMAFSLSSTAFVLQLLRERKEIDKRYGTTCFSILLMQDLAIIPMLAVLPFLADVPVANETPVWQKAGLLVGMFILILLYGRYLVPYVFKKLAGQQNHEGFLLVVLLTVLLAAWAMHLAGVSMALGAFVMGMLLSGSHYRHHVQALIEPYKGLLMSLFFVAVGMSIDLPALGEHFLTYMQHTVVIIAIKIVVIFALTLLFGYKIPSASRVAFYLSQGGEFGFVLFGSALVLQVIDTEIFTMAISVISITMLATPLLVHIANAIAKRFEKKALAELTQSRHPTEQALLNKKVVIGGYGRVGHTIAVLLDSSQIPFVAFDMDIDRVFQGEKDGFHVFYGDICDLDLLTTLNLESDSLVILTIDSAEAAVQAISHIRTTSTDVRVIARGRDLRVCGQLMAAGANYAYPEAVEGSLRMGALALKMIEVPEKNIQDLLDEIRLTNYDLVAE